MGGLGGEGELRHWLDFPLVCLKPAVVALQERREEMMKEEKQRRKKQHRKNIIFLLLNIQSFVYPPAPQTEAG